MARKRIEKKTTRIGVPITEAAIGDYCYYLSTSNKPVLAEISSMSEESGIKVFLLICQVDYKFMTVAAAICSFNEKDLKGKKRHDLCPAVYK